jgi:hypothetical protein
MRDALEQRDFCTAAAAFSSGVAEKLKAFRPEVALSCQFDLCPPSDGCAGASQQNSCTSRDVWPATATLPQPKQNGNGWNFAIDANALCSVPAHSWQRET